MDFFRLNSVSPRLASLYRSSTTAKKRKAATKACRYALESTGLSSNQTFKHLELLDKGDAVDADSSAKALEWTSQLDESYLNLLDDGENSNNDEVMNAFTIPSIG